MVGYTKTTGKFRKKIMKLTGEIIKKEYQAPQLTCTNLDNSISLELQSEPPIGPGEPGFSAHAPEYFNSNNPLNA